MTSGPKAGGEGWARTVIEGVAEGEGTDDPSSPSTPSDGDGEADTTEGLEIVDLDEIDTAPGLEGVAGQTEEAVVEEAMEEVVESDESSENNGESAGAEPIEAAEADVVEGETVDVVDTDLVDTDLADGVQDPGAPRVASDEMSVEDLVNDLERVSVERDQYLDASRRLQAEFENYKKQVSKREANARERANDSLVQELLPVFDAFDGALANGAEDVAPMRTSFLEAMAKQGLERIDPEEGPFDPALHEAVMHEDGQEPDGPVVAEVLRAGYSWKGRVLRPAMVKTRG